MCTSYPDKSQNLYVKKLNFMITMHKRPSYAITTA